MSSVTTDVDRLKITKANNLIEITLVETNYRLSLRDQKLILAVISQISPDDRDFKNYRITITDLVKLTGINNKDLYREISSICTRLMSSVITIKEPGNSKGFLMVTWFSHARYLADEGCVEFSISPELKTYLLQLKEQFTTYHLRQVVNLQSTYSIRLYELLRQFLSLKKVQKGQFKGFRELSLHDLRSYLGVESKRYGLFSDFRRYVLEKSRNELAEKTDLTFDFEPIRKGRKINAIKFIIRHNHKFEPVLEDETLTSEPYLKELNAGLAAMIRLQIPDISDDEILYMEAAYGPMLIMEALMELSEAVATGKIKTARLPYFKGILKNKHNDLQNNLATPVTKTTEQKLTDLSWSDGLED